MPHDTNIGELYETVKLGVLRIYLGTFDREESEASSEDLQTPDAPPDPETLDTPPDLETLDAPSDPETSDAPPDLETTDAPPESTDDCYITSVTNLSADDEIQFGPVDNPDYNSEDTLPLDEPQADISPLSPEEAHVATHPNVAPKVLRLHRVNIVSDMVEQFKDSSFMEANLSVTFINESGIDASGVARDAYSCFWEMFFLNCADGEAEYVPALQPEYGREEWEAIGRILMKGYKDHGFFPIKLSLAFTVCLIHGENKVTEEMLFESFLRFVTPFEKDIVNAVLEGRPYSEDDLLDMLSRMGGHTAPDGDTVKDSIVHTAHKQLIQEPMYALKMMAATAQVTLKSLLPTVSAVTALYKNKVPTATGIIALLRFDEKQPSHSKTMQFLKLFIRSLDKDKLHTFLRFTTGSDVICVSHIDVEFTDVRGLQRCPVVHTCGPLLQIPCTYSTYSEFRREFVSVLEANYLKMDLL
ncbi:uncharacterized protein LOC131973627 [Centropristis striata]|uniref:uncharacterized protein LOC131973627 n=1 Tax=Centropristis striata TaxID=184440 RepID=UPI0027E18D17|nr:uncharacterized protein LOC131973627 [Centropristis striata]